MLSRANPLFALISILSAKGVNGEWKVWGLPKKIHVDNGMDFRTETLKRACLEYGITLEHRPVRVPNYGGHIERLIGTLMRESHQLASITFSNIKEKDNYKSVNKASFTFDELEEWLLNLIVNIYHKRIHRGIEMRPEVRTANRVNTCFDGIRAMWQSFTFLIRIQKVMSVFLQRIKSFPEQAYGNCGKQKNVCVNWEEKITTSIN